jgi:AraC family transcriptional regulator, regulatory protein of adaptative response / DNA-3-methyladenine glycosylase II
VPSWTSFVPAREPFDGRAVLDFLAARAVPGVEEVAGGRYRRTLALPGGPALVAVVPAAAGVRCELELREAADAGEAVARCAHLFGVHADPAAVVATLGQDPLLEPLVRRRPDLRVPGAADGFELAVRAIVGQQVSVAAARTVLGRIAALHGEPLAEPAGALTHLFPSPAALAAVDPDGLPFPRARAEALRALARLAGSGELRLDRDADPGETRAGLMAIPGVGPWTADYVAMRALADPDVFLAADVGVRNALARLGGTPDPERWRPWRSYATVHLWRSLG